jgi:GT2 family glycosyltransferase
VPDVSVLIVNWNDRLHLEECLAALTGQDVETVVVDNASDDGSADMVATEHPWVRLERAEQNLGFAGGINRAAAAAGGRYLLLLNPDARPEAGAVECLRDYLEEHANAAGAAGLLLGPGGVPQRGWNVRRLPTPVSLASELLLFDRLWPGNPIARRHNALDLDYSRPTIVEQPAAACLMLRRDVFDGVGGLDERFHPAWFEDVDLCRRLKDRGAQLHFVPAARFAHAGGASRARLSRAAYTRIYYTNLLRFVRKHWGVGWSAVFRALVGVGMLSRAAASLAGGNRQAATAYASVVFPREPL